MKITKQLLKDIEEALDMRGKDGNPIWEDGDEVEVCITSV